MDIKFRTKFDRIRVYTDPGDPMVNDYMSVYDDDGKRKVIVSGQYNLYDKIQSYRDNCDLHTILERYKRTGDETLLMRRQAVFADVTEMPKTYADVLKLSMASQGLFDALTAEQKLKFNNNPDEFLASFGTPKFDEVFKAIDEKTELQKEEAKEEKING